MNIGELIATLGVDTKDLSRATEEFKKFGDSAKSAISASSNSLKQQTGIIAEIEQTIAKLEQSKKNAFNYDDIVKYNKKIAEAKFYLKEYQTAGLEANEKIKEKTKETVSAAEEYNHAVEKLSRGIMGIVGVAATIEVLKKAWEGYSKIMESTEGTELKLQETTLSVKFALDEVSRSIATGNFKDFVSRLFEAANNGEKLAQQLELVNNLSLQLKLVEADVKLQMSQQQLIYRNQALSYNTRLEAAKKYLELNRESEKEQLDVAKEQLKVALEASSVAASGLSKDRLEWYATNAGNIKRSSEELEIYLGYVEKLKLAEENPAKLVMQMGLGGMEEIPQVIKELEEMINSTDPLIKNMASDFKKWEEISSPDKTGLVEAWAHLKDVMTEANQRALRPTRTLGELMRENAKQTEDQSKSITDRYKVHLDAQTKMLEQSRKLNELESKSPINYQTFFMRTSVGDMSGVEALQTKLADLALKNAKFGDSLDPLGTELKGIGDQMNFVTEKGQAMWDQGIRPGSAALDASGMSLDQYIEKLKELQLTQDEAARKMQNLRMINEQMASAFVSVTNIIGESLAGQGNAFESLNALVLDTAQSIINALLKEAIMASIAKGVISEGLIGLAGAAITIAAIKSMWENNKDASAEMAQGGIVPPGYPNDTYPAKLTSGEIVSPPGKLDNIMKENKVNVTIEPVLKGEDIFWIVKEIGRKHNNVFGG